MNNKDDIYSIFNDNSFSLGIYSERLFFILWDLYIRDWMLHNAVEYPIFDATSKGWTYTNINKNQSEEINNFLENINFNKTFKRALSSEALFGGCVLFLGTDDDDLSLPITKQSKLLYINLLGRLDIQKVFYNRNPLDSSLSKNHFLQIAGNQIHSSRTIIFGGVSSPVITYQSELMSLNNGIFSPPPFLKIIKDILLARKTRHIVGSLIEKKSILVLSGRAHTQPNTTQEGSIKNILKNLNSENSIYLNSDTDTEMKLEAIGVDISGLTDIMKAQQEVVVAGVQSTIMRFMGQMPGGINGSDSAESSMSLYYDGIIGYQDHILSRIKTVVDLVALRLGISDDVKVEFNPLWESSPLEKSQIDTNYANIIINATNSNIIDTEEAAVELKAREIFVNINDKNIETSEEERENSLISREDVKQEFNGLESKLNNDDNITK